MSDETSSTGSESTAEAPDTPTERVADAAQIPQQPSAPTAETRPAPVMPVFPPLPAPVVTTPDPTPQPTVEPTPAPLPSVEPAPEPAVVAVTAQSGPPPAELFAPTAPAARTAPEPATGVEPAPPQEPAADLTPAPPAVPADSTTGEETRPGSKKGVLIGTGVAVIVLGLLALVGWLIYVKFYVDPIRGAQPGHCLADLPIVPVGEEAQVSDARFVDCREPDATYRVVGRVDDVTEDAAKDPAICEGFRDLSAIYRAVPSGGTGYVLCLSQVEHD